MIDKTLIIVKYHSLLNKQELSQFGAITADLAKIGILFLKLSAYLDPDAAVSLIAAVHGVKSAEFNTKREAPKTLASVWTGTVGDFNRFIYQEMNLETAWAVTKGDPRIKIAVIDSGCDTRHPNLTVRGGGIFKEGTYATSQTFPMKINWYELCGEVKPYDTYDNERAVVTVCKATDDFYLNPPTEPVTCYWDSTCKDVAFVGNKVFSYRTEPLEFWVKEPVDIRLVYSESEDASIDQWITGIGCNVMSDGYAHGTNCCGIINGQHDRYGVLGVAPGCTTIAYKALSDQAWTSGADLAAAIYRAVEDGCHVISYSIAGSYGVITAAEWAAFDYALSEGVVFFAAASNSGDNPQTDVATDRYEYPASYSTVISVGACGDRLSQSDAMGWIDSEPDIMDYSRISYFSQKNDKVFILAPGDGWKLHTPQEIAFMWQQVRNRTEKWVKGYTCQSEGGTSYATPAAAGVGALMLSKALIGQTTQDPAEVKAILAATIPASRVRDILAATAKIPVRLSNGGPATVGFGHGRIDAGAAVASV